jgi:2,5-dihydroxypyridine 5,6-dioxygenase
VTPDGPLGDAARRVVRAVLAVRPGEAVVVVRDATSDAAVGEALAAAVAAAGATPVTVAMPPLAVGGQEPPRPVAAALRAADAAILHAGYALFHTAAVRAALAAGVRTVDMWGVDAALMVAGGMAADHAEIERLTRAVAARLAAGDRVRLTTAAGTDLRLSVRGRRCTPLGADASRPGGHCALPAGEVAVAPVPGSAEGVIVDPYVLERRDLAFRREPFVMELADGEVQGVHGGREAEAVAAMIAAVGPCARQVAEFALGTNRWCRLGATLREAKKAWGTAHVAIGDSRSLGGDVDCPVHMDIVLRAPTVTLDGEVLVADGRLLVD